MDRKNRKDKGGGRFGILISDRIAHHVTEDNNTDDLGLTETCWVKLKCRPKNIAVGVFYGPQEKEKLEKVTEIYNNLETQINQLNQSNEIILGGDFNAKLELTHKIGVQTLSRNGKLLKTMIDNTRLTPTSTEADTGFWTRVNRNKPSENR